MYPQQEPHQPPPGRGTTQGTSNATGRGMAPMMGNAARRNNDSKQATTSQKTVMKQHLDDPVLERERARCSAEQYF